MSNKCTCSMCLADKAKAETAASRQSRSKALLGELYANLCRAADIIVSEYPTHDHRYKEAEGWIMNSLVDARRELNIKSPNARSDRSNEG